MRYLRVRPTVSSIKVFAVSALLAAGAASCAVPDANAASGGFWTATTKAEADFMCISDDCNAGGVGYLPNGRWIGSVGYNNQTIGAWQRTVGHSLARRSMRESDGSRARPTT